MPNLGEIVECNACGNAQPWASSTKLAKVLPGGWSRMAETAAGEVFFCSPVCEDVWKSTREWATPPVAAIRNAKEAGYSIPEPVTAPTIGPEQVNATSGEHAPANG